MIITRQMIETQLPINVKYVSNIFNSGGGRTSISGNGATSYNGITDIKHEIIIESVLLLTRIRAKLVK